MNLLCKLQTEVKSSRLVILNSSGLSQFTIYIYICLGDSKAFQKKGKIQGGKSYKFHTKNNKNSSFVDYHKEG